MATVTRAYLPDPDRDPPLDCGFAEIYWANVPRKPAAEKYILEDPKNWVRSLVERLELRIHHANRNSNGADTEKERHETALLQQVLDEMIQAVVVVDRVPFLAGSAGFNMKKLLVDYLNDVQVITEFDNYREELLDIFREVLETTYQFFPDAELYLIAHSEGTVITFMGLLKGLSTSAGWAKRVKGLMTIGSPLNKHIRLWPELFEEFVAPADLPQEMQPIQWKNYYDYGDPVAYNLRVTRKWMVDHSWIRFFDFKGPQDGRSTADGSRGPLAAKARGVEADEFGGDIGFSRYFFPGAAHYNYWSDPDVFGHFFQTVVDPSEEYLPARSGKKFGPPATIPLAWVSTYTLPYLVSAMLLVLGIYVLYKAVRACIDPIGAGLESSGEIIRNVLGLSSLIAGTTLIARVPCLTKHWKPRLGALLLGVAASLMYLVAVSPENQVNIARFLELEHPAATVVLAVILGVVWALLAWATLGKLEADLPPWMRGPAPVLLTLVPVCWWYHFLTVLSPMLDRANLVVSGHAPIPLGRSVAVVLVALVVGVTASLVSRKFPKVGLRPLMYTSGLVLFTIILAQVQYYRARAAAGGQNRIIQVLHRRIDTLERRLSHYLQSLVRDRVSLEEEIAAIKTRGGPPGELEVKTAARSAMDRLIVKRTALDDERAKLDRDLHELARVWAPREQLQSKVSKMQEIDESLLTDEIAPEDRRDAVLSAALQAVTSAAQVQGPVWPVFVCGAVFFYLWWLAVLNFDLALIWHFYIKNEGVDEYIQGRFGPKAPRTTAPTV
jgi:hypothetical protein